MLSLPRDPGTLMGKFKPDRNKSDFSKTSPMISWNSLRMKGIQRRGIAESLRPLLDVPSGHSFVHQLLTAARILQESKRAASPPVGSIFLCMLRGSWNGPMSTSCVAPLISDWNLTSCVFVSLLHFNFDGQFPPPMMEDREAQNGNTLSSVCEFIDRYKVTCHGETLRDVFGHQHTYKVIYVEKSEQSRVHVSYK